MTIKLMFSVVALVFCLVGSALGQETTGSIEGTVVDPNGARVPNASVTVTGGSFNRTTTTDSNGLYRIAALPPGFYSVEVAAGNFSTSKRDRDVEVVLGKATPVNFTLAAGQVGETVTVTTQDSPAIDVSDSKVATNISAETIARLPKGTGFTSLLKASPGTREEPLSGGFQVDGASGSENTFIIDGQEVTNFRTGVLNANNNIPLGFVQEIQIKTGGFEAEYGGATGGVINVVTKGGSNEWHGEIGLMFEPSELQAGPRPILTTDDVTLRYIVPRRDTTLNTFPNFSLGGPIVKDRLWFYTSHSPQFFRTERGFVFGDGSAQNYVSKERRDYSFLRLDGQVSDSVRLYGTYQYSPRRIRGVIPSNTSLDATTPRGGLTAAERAPSPSNQAEQGGRVPATNITAAGTWTPTSKLVLDVRWGRGYLNEKVNSYGIPNIVRFRCITAGPQCSAGFANVPNIFSTLKDISIRKTFDVDASYLFSGLGRHNVKGGYQRNSITNDVEEGYFNTGEIRLFFGRNFEGQGVATGGLGYGYLQRFGTVGLAGSTNEGVYIQDSWQIARRLTLNLGLRMERENVPSFTEGGIPLNFSFGDKLAPRLGFAYDLTGNGKTKIFASFGRFFDRFKYELPRGSFGGDKFLRNYFVIQAAQSNPFFYTREYAFANDYLERDFRVPSNDPTQPTLDLDLKAVRQTEFTVGAEHSLTKDIVLAVRYTRKKLDRTIEDVGIPDAGGNETYYITNPGSPFLDIISQILPGVPPTPAAERVYDAVEVRVDKRFSRNYYINGSYTWSRLYGNYGGLANSDEGGRTSPNVNRVFDLPFEPFTPEGVPNNGLLSTDRTHVLKVFGAYTFDWKSFFGRNLEGSGRNTTDFSFFSTAQTGTPISSRVDLLDVATVVLNKRGDLGRTEPFTQTDFSVTHKYKFGNDGRFAIAVDVNLLNAFNETNELARYDLISGAVFQAPDFGLADGGEAIKAIFQGNGLRDEIEALLGTEGFERDARFNQPNLFQNGRQIRFGFRFMF